jgi:hypothetical protein
MRFKLLFSRTTVTIQNMYTYHYHNTKYVHLTLPQHKTCTRTTTTKKTRTRTTTTIQNMYTYHYHNTKHVHVPPSQYTTCWHTTTTIHVHVPPSQYKTCTRTTTTIQNIYTYYYHNTKHVNLPLSQYKTYTHTTVKIQIMYTYHYHNIKYVSTPVCTENINAYSQNSGLRECFTVWQVRKCQPAKQQCCWTLKFLRWYFSNLTRLDDRKESVFIFRQRNSIVLYTL